MSKKIPENGRWIVDPSKDMGLALLAVKNMNFDRVGRAALAAKVLAIFRTVEDANFEIPISVYNSGNGINKIMTSDNNPFSVDMDDLTPSFSMDGLSNQPSGSLDGSGELFDGKWVITEASDMNSFDGSTWTDHSVSLTSGKRHPLKEMKSNRTLLIGNGAQVKQVNTSFTETTNLTLPSGLEVCGIAYNRSMAAIITIDTYENEAWLYIWDAATTAANYSYPLGAVRAICVIPYKDTFVIVNGNGQLLYWTTAGLQVLAILPAYIRDALWADASTTNKGHDTSIIVDGDRILFNIAAVDDSRNSEPDRYNPLQPAGVWCYDPKVGAPYHRHAPSGCRTFGKSVNTTQVDPATDIITVSATGGDVPATGTPAFYGSISTPLIGGLSEMVPYYVIKLSATTFKLAASRADAAAGIAIDLTSTGNVFQEIAFIEEFDFGQLSADRLGGVLAFTGRTPENSGLQYALYNRYCFGQADVYGRAVGGSTDFDVFCIVSNQGENRGYVLTQKIPADGITDDWAKLFLKPRNLLDVDDKIIVKYRKSEDRNFPIYARAFDKLGTWVDENTFTTDANLAAAKAAFDAGHAYEIEFIGGAGSGYLAHITEISLAGSTYTVSIDESIRGIAAADTCYFIVNNFEKLLKAGSSSAEITSADDPNVVELPIGGDPSRWIQFKIELRGKDVEIEGLEIINTPHQQAV